MIAKLLLFLSCIIAVIADMMLVFYAKEHSNNIWWFIGAFILNTIGIAIWTYTMNTGIESAVAITVYAILTTIGCTLLGSYLFNEHLSTTNIIGVVLAIISLILINI